MLDAEKTIVQPFLKWPGGKRWISKEIVRILIEELDGCYFEPFLGAGAVFLQLQPLDSLLSDVNADLIRFLTICSDDPEGVVTATWRFTNTKECYYRVRASKPRSDVAWAARFLFLNRTCWGGIYRLNRHGDFNVPFGDSGRIICSKQAVVQASSVFQTAELGVHDFEISFDRADRGDVIYADPPYTSRGQYNGFVRYNESLFSWSDQLRLSSVAKAARRRGVFVAISGVMHRDILSLYKNWWMMSFRRSSCVAREPQRRGVFHEALLMSRRPRCNMQDRVILRITNRRIASITSANCLQHSIRGNGKESP